MTTFGLWLIFCILPIICGYIFIKLITGWNECILLNWRINLAISPLIYIMGFLIGLLLLLPCFTIAFAGSECEKLDPKEMQIYSLSKCMITNIETNKNMPFQLGIGNNDSTYSFLVYTNNHYEFKEVSTANFKIIYTDSVKPKIHIDATKHKLVPKRLKWIFTTDIHNVDLENWAGTIYIPKGSIVRPYKQI